MALSEKEKKDEFVKHSEIKTYESKAKETVRGSARHSSKFSNEKSIIEDNSKKIEALDQYILRPVMNYKKANMDLSDHYQIVLKAVIH